MIEERGPIEQAAKPSGELAGVSREVIRAKLIHRDHDHQREVDSSLVGSRLLRRGGDRGTEGEEG
jgi:hypothetical protein